jgi:hypothetical protein
MNYRQIIDTNDKSFAEVKELIRLKLHEATESLLSIKSDLHKLTESDQEQIAKRTRKRLSTTQHTIQSVKSLLLDYQKLRKKRRTVKQYL